VRARQESGRLDDRIAHQLLRKLLRPLVVGDGAEDRSAKGEQIDEAGAFFNALATQSRVGLEAVDLRA
jgi:hypothetical protein